VNAWSRPPQNYWFLNKITIKIIVLKRSTNKKPKTKSKNQIKIAIRLLILESNKRLKLFNIKSLNKD
jgi:hypothetical protein